MKTSCVLSQFTPKIYFYNEDGALADPTAVLLYVSKPSVADGVTTYSVVTYSYALAEITKVGTGIYKKSLTPAETEYGIWTYEWKGTGSVAWYGPEGGVKRKVVARTVS